MNILKSGQKELSKLGIYLCGTSTQLYPFNSRTVFVLIVQCVGTALSCVHLFYIAKTFSEYIFSAYTTSAMLTATLCFATIVWKVQPISSYLDSVEKTINKSGFAVAFKLGTESFIFIFFN